MTIQDLKDNGALYIANIEEGLKKYSYEVKHFSAAAAYESLLAEWRENGTSDSFTDFYYFTLGEESKEKVNTLLSRSELEYLEELENAYYRQKIRQENPIIFYLDEVLLGIVVKLNAAEMLFSTIYFTRTKETWWGNYNEEYVIFKTEGRTLCRH